jgi:hypothetical protein
MVATHRPNPAGKSQRVSAGDSFAFGDQATVTVQRSRVDRDTVTDREWLAFVDDRVEAISRLPQLVVERMGRNPAWELGSGDFVQLVRVCPRVRVAWAGAGRSGGL